jgi:prophage DNA circulation protein
MSWRDKYRQASFRGIPFNIEKVFDKKGNRLAIHEFPGRNKPKIKNMGKAVRFIQSEAFLIGPDYLDQLANLTAALDKSGPGILVHPFFGDILVEINQYGIDINNQELGICRLPIEFVSVGTDPNFVVGINTQARVLTSAKSAVEKHKTWFEKTYDYASLPYSKAQQVLESVQNLNAKMYAVRKTVQLVPKFFQTIKDIASSAGVLVLQAGKLFDEVYEIITFGFLTEDNDNDGEIDTKQAFFEVAEAARFSPEIQFESETNSAFLFTSQLLATVQIAHMLSIMEFKSSTEAIELKLVVSEQLDSLSNNPLIDDTVFEALRELNAEVETHISAQIALLPKLVEITLSSSTPSAILSYELYGSLEFEQEIIERNKIKIPGFIPSNVPILVLTNAE